MIVVVQADGTVVGPVDDSEVISADGGDGGTALQRFGVSLTGGDLSSWDLTSGSVLLAPGAQLFAAPSVTHRWNSSPTVDGSRWGGMRTDQQDQVMPVVVLADDWATWRDTDAAFFRAVHPGSECLLTVTTPDGVQRSLGLRFVAGGGVETDPLANFYASYALEFTSSNPFWRGESVVASFDVSPPLPLFPGPPFNINPSSTASGSVVTNPGDEPVWPRYLIQGPASSWSVGVGDALVSSSRALTASQSVMVDMDPAKLTVLDQDGNDIYEVLSADTFAPIPAGADVELSLDVAGYGTGSKVTVEFTPLYRRPW